MDPAFSTTTALVTLVQSTQVASSAAGLRGISAEDLNFPAMVWGTNEFARNAFIAMPGLTWLVRSSLASALARKISSMGRARASRPHMRSCSRAESGHAS